MKILVFLCFMIPSLVKAQTGDVIDRIIGVVGNEIVLHSDLESSILEMTKGKGGLGTMERCGVFENLLYQKLLLNQSKLDSIEVSDAEVQSQVTRRLDYFMSMFGSAEEFEKYYGKTSAQMKDEYFDLIKDQILVQRVQEKINKNTKVTPADVARFYKTVPADSLPLIGEQVQYSQIVIQPAVRESENQRIIQFLDSLRNNLINGRSSMTLEAAKWSEDPGSRYKGGCYPLQRKGSFVPEYEAAVFNTPEGGFSPVFSSTYGYHFVKVIERRGDFYESCHILMSPKVKNDDLSNARIELEAVRMKLMSDTLSFTTAASRYSTEEETKNQGGKVLSASTGGTKHEVASLGADLNLILMNLQEGQVSDAVLATKEDGSQYYVIYRLDKRFNAHTADLKNDYEIFKSIAENDAKQKEVDKWVRKTIDKTYISINTDFQSCDYQFPWLKNKP